MAREPLPEGARRKLIEFDAETWQALHLLARDRMATVQELAEEAFADLLDKHGRPVTLKEALEASTAQDAAGDPGPRRRKRKPTKIRRGGRGKPKSG